MKFTKQILKPGKYRAHTLDGPKDVEVSEERLKQWVDTFSSMTDQEDPLRIPAPWKHDGSNPITTDEKAADNNAGFWEKLWQEKDGSVWGTLDVPREEDASKVGTSVREVSPYVLPNWSDGLKREYKEGPLHIALVTHPVMPGQTNFEKVKGKHTKGTPALALAMSQMIFAEGVAEPQSATNVASTNASDASVKDALEALARHNITLPQDTTAENFIERIITAVIALDGKEQNEEDPNRVQGQGTEKPLPIAMGENVMKVTVSKDGKALEFASATECEEFQSTVKDHEAKQTESETAIKKALGFACEAVKKSFIARIESLVTSGKLPRSVAVDKLKPMVEAYEFSLDDKGERVKGHIDTSLEIAEAYPPNATGYGGLGKFLSDGPEGKEPKKQETMFSFEQELPEAYDGGEISDAEADKLADKQLQDAQLIPMKA